MRRRTFISSLAAGTLISAVGESSTTKFPVERIVADVQGTWREHGDVMGDEEAHAYVASTIEWLNSELVHSGCAPVEVREGVVELREEELDAWGVAVHGGAVALASWSLCATREKEGAPWGDQPGAQLLAFNTEAEALRARFFEEFVAHRQAHG